MKQRQAKIKRVDIICGDTLEIASRSFGDTRTVHVFLPEGYRESEAPYPVLYLFDGGMHNLTASALNEQLAFFGMMPRLIVVGIAHKDRFAELTPTPDGGGRKFAARKAGDAQKTYNLLVREVIPHIESNYRTAPWRMVGGSSLGGLMTIHCLLRNPGLFQAYFAITPSLWWHDGLYVARAEKMFTRFKNTGRRLDRHLHLSVGNESPDHVRQILAFRDLMRDYGPDGMRWNFQLLPGESHCTVMPLSFWQGFKWVFDGWELPAQPKDRPLSSTAIRAHYEALSSKYGYAVPYPIDRIETAARYDIDHGQAKNAIRLLRLGLERSPHLESMRTLLAEVRAKVRLRKCKLNRKQK